MKLKPSVLERVLAAFQDGDLDECIRQVRTLVEAAPQATAPRQLLAALFAQTGNGRLALAHYQRLLPQAVARGEVIRTIAFQKQIDAFQRPELHPPVRWAVLQTQLRGQGVPFVPAPPGGTGRPWSESQLLALPRTWFERVAEETRVEFLGLEPLTVDLEAGTVWEVLAGRMRWSFALADGRASVESLAAEGDAVHVDPGLARTVRLSFVPELPVEILRFDAPFARELKATLSPSCPAAARPDEGFVREHEARALLPTRPRRREDLDERPSVPASEAGAEPPRLVPEAEADTRLRDTGDWVEFGVLSLPEGAAGAGTSPPEPRERPASGDATSAPEDEAAVGDAPTAPEPTVGAFAEASAAGDTPPARDEEPAIAGAPLEHEDESVVGARSPQEEEPLGAAPEGEPDAGLEEAPEREHILRLPPLAERPLHPRNWSRDDEPAEMDADEEPVHTPTPDPFAGPIVGPEPIIERRRHPRMVISLESRVALLRLSGARVKPVRGQLNDLSTSGLSVRFANHTLGTSRALLAEAVVAVELGMPGAGGPLRVAAQVRWLEVDDEHDETRIGIEFVLLTEPDRRRIAGTLARAALAAHHALRRVA